MTLAALDASLIYDCNITDIVLIEICGKLLTIYNIMTAVPVEMVCRPTVKRLIYASYAISLSYQLESSRSRRAIRQLTLLNAISGYARA